MLPRSIGVAALALVLSLPAASVVAQQPSTEGALGASLDPAAAVAGRYKLDHEHASIIARLSHRGVSMSTLRFGSASGTLDWDPERIEAAKLHITVETASLTSPIAFRILPTGEQFLNVAKFPRATFVSTAVRRTGAGQGRIEGDLTLLGVTRPVSIDAELVGIKSTNGVLAIGFSGTAKIRRSDFGNTFLAASVGDEVELLLDVEFLKE
jgi:polyisoprenoid-binding protein YceI